MFSIKGQIVNIFGIVGYEISDATTQLCSWSTEAAINNM